MGESVSNDKPQHLDVVAVRYSDVLGETMMSPKQQKIISMLRHDGSTINLSDAVVAIGGDIHAQKKRYVGKILSNMVKRRIIDRVKPGIFCKAKKRMKKSTPLFDLGT